MTLLYRLALLIVPPVVRVYFRLRVEGRERVPRTGGLLIAANHSSYLDPVLIGCATRRDLHFLARASLFRFPVFGWLIRNLQAIPLAKGGGERAALRCAREMVQADAVMVVFPEGTRTLDGSLGNPHPGVGMLALQSGVPVIPVHIEGAFRAMPRGTRFPRPRRITIRWGEAKTAEQWLTGNPRSDRPARALSAILLREIASLGGQRLSGEENEIPILDPEQTTPLTDESNWGSAPDQAQEIRVESSHTRQPNPENNP